MRNFFEWTEEEKAAATGSEQLAMLQRLVDFVNANLTDIEALKNPETSNPK